jgi:arsenate reductase
MPRQKALFICVHNSARSQMAAAYLNQICGQFFEAQSAGLKPGTINPLVIEAFREVGLDISNNRTQGVDEVWKSGPIFQFVITVCSEVEAEGCPIFPGLTTRLHWPFDDPSKLIGSHDEKLVGVRRIRDQIGNKIARWCATPGSLIGASNFFELAVAVTITLFGATSRLHWQPSPWSWSRSRSCCPSAKSALDRVRGTSAVCNSNIPILLPNVPPRYV